MLRVFQLERPATKDTTHKLVWEEGLIYFWETEMVIVEDCWVDLGGWFYWLRLSELQTDDVDDAGETFPMLSASLGWIYSHPHAHESKVIFKPAWSRGDGFLMNRDDKIKKSDWNSGGFSWQSQFSLSDSWWSGLGGADGWKPQQHWKPSVWNILTKNL